MSRTIDTVILHCSATRKGQPCNAQIIDRWHRNRGWKGIGYHFVLLENGDVEFGRPLTWQGAHAKGYNETSVGVVYIGGVDDELQPMDTMNVLQENAFRELFCNLEAVLGPLALIGHNEVSSKACPSFRVSDKFPDLCTISL